MKITRDITPDNTGLYWAEGYICTLQVMGVGVSFAQAIDSAFEDYELKQNHERA